MKDNWESAEEVLYGFMQATFFGAMPKAGGATSSELEEIAVTLQTIAGLTPGDAALWPAGRRAALYECLSLALIKLRLLRPGFSQGDLRGSSSHSLAQPLLTALVVIAGTPLD